MEDTSSEAMQPTYDAIVTMERDAQVANYAPAIHAIRWLAERCDGAFAADGQGFSGADSPLGRALAEKSIWSPREALAGLNLVVKYRGQLQHGGVDTGGFEQQHQALTKELRDTPRLRRSDSLAGTISVDEGHRCIIVKTGYHAGLVNEVRELIGAKWSPEKREWTCSLCAENAVPIEELAARWGLTLRKHSGWNALAPVRSVGATECWLRVSGVNARAIARSMPPLYGRPEMDEAIFRGVQAVGDIEIVIPLTSWTIRDALLWIEAWDDDNARRLGWAREEVLQTLRDAYPDALRVEQSRSASSSALALCAEDLATISSKVPVAFADRLMAHQWVAVKSLTEHTQSILGDEQGLGKTIEVLAALEASRAFPAVVVVPAIALLNWRDEIEDWLPNRRTAVVGERIGKSDQGCPINDAEIVVLNYEAFSKHSATLTDLRPKALVCDEAQNLKSHDSERTLAVKQFCELSGVERIVMVSGTPMLNRPAELLTLLTLLPDLLAELGGFGRFASRYCRATRYSSRWSTYWDYGGAANLDELAVRLRESGRFIRRDKASVLPSLKPKLCEQLSVDITNREEVQLAKSDLAEWYRVRLQASAPTKQDHSSEPSELTPLCEAASWLGYDTHGTRDFGFERSEGLRRIVALRRLAGIGKVEAAAQWILKHASLEKVVVFAFHIEVQESLVNAVRAGGLDTVLSITGGMSPKLRHDAIQKFQCDPRARVIVCSLTASRTAITLTAAARALIVELDWTPGGLEQAEDRIHRIGQSGQVTITYLVASETLDDRMLSILARKRSLIRALTSASAVCGAESRYGLEIDAKTTFVTAAAQSALAVSMSCRSLP